MGRTSRRRVAAAVATAIAAGAGDPGPYRALLAGGTAAQLADPAAAQLTADTAAYHNLLPLLWRAVADPATPPALADAVRVAYRPVVARALRLRAALDPLVDALRAAGIDHAVFKGPALWPFYPDPRARVSVDIDVLIRPADRAGAHAALQAAGFLGPLPPSDPAPGVAEVDYLWPDTNTVVDLHWHVMREARVRRMFTLTSAELLGRSRTARLDGLDVRVLDDADAALAVATHACYDGAYRLGWLVDLALVLRRVDPAELGARARAAGLELPLAVMTDRLARSLGLRAGPASGTGRSWRTALDLATRLRPPARAFQAPLRAGLLYRATGPTTWAGLGELARLAGGGAGATVRAMRRRTGQQRDARDR